MNEGTLTAPTEPALAPGGALCRACLHGVRGLPVNGTCSECKAPLAPGLDRAWWGNAPIGYLQDLRVYARHALIASTIVPATWLISRIAVPATVTTLGQNDTARVVIYTVSGVATAVCALLTARFFLKASLLGTPRDRRLVIAAWVCVFAAAVGLLSSLATLLISPVRIPALFMWAMLANLIAAPVSVLAAGRAFIGAAPHIGGAALSRLATLHIVAGSLLLVASIPFIAAYASFLSGSMGLSSWWMPMMAWLPAVYTWAAMAPVVILPVVLVVFTAALHRLVEARRAGT